MTLNHHPRGRRLSSPDGADGVEMEAQCQVRRLLRRLRQQREAQGLSQKELGRRCGLTQTTVGNIENGKADHPAYTTLYRLARALGLELQLKLCKPKK